MTRDYVAVSRWGGAPGCLCQRRGFGDRLDDRLDDRFGAGFDDELLFFVELFLALFDDELEDDGAM